MASAGGIQAGLGYFDGVKLSSLHKRIMLLVAVCYMFDQMDTNTFAYAAPVLRETWGVTMEQIAQVNSYYLWGMFMGAVFGGWLADKMGRKATLIFCVAVFSLASIGGGLATNFSFLAFTRFICGIGLIGMVVVATVFIAEMTPSDRRGQLVSLTVAFGTLGVPVGAALARWIVPLSAESWRYIFLLGGATVFLLPLCFAWFKESPRWLVSRGRLGEAEKVIKELTGQEVKWSLQAIETATRGSNLEALRVMFSRVYLRRTLVLFLITIGVVVGGAHLLAGFYPTILQEYAGFELTLVLSIMAISWWGIPFGHVSAALVSDRGGRKIPLAIYSIINGLAYIVCGFMALPVVVTAALFISRVFGGGSASMLYTYLAECYPTHVRSNAVGLLMGSSRVIAAVAVLIVPPVLRAYGWLGIHLLNAAIILIPAIIVLIWGERTSGRTLEELNKQL
ncbi:MAG: MFS transporter [Moorellaceae bacterium]